MTGAPFHAPVIADVDVCVVGAGSIGKGVGVGARRADWRGGSTPRIASTPETYDGQVVIKREILPDGRQKLILKDPASGDFSDRVVPGS